MAMPMDDERDHPRLSVGTQVVTRAAVRDAAGGLVAAQGVVGVVVTAAGQPPAYRVRFNDGAEAVLARGALTIRKHYQRSAIAGETGVDLSDYVIYRVVIGSRAYGLEVEGSDYDRRGIYLPPARLHWSLRGLPGQLEQPGTADSYWELQKFLTMALKANPNILECLYSPLVELATPLADELVAMRSAFLSKLVYQTYNGYVASQFRLLRQDLENRGEIRWKHAMHLIRLLLAGIGTLEQGVVPVRVDEHRERLLAIRGAELPWDEIDAWRLILHKRFDEAYAGTTLPDQPDVAAVDAFLIRARRAMVDA